MTARIEEMGGEVRLNTPVTKIELDDEQRVTALHIGDEVIEPEAVISSLPLATTVAIADPVAPKETRDAAFGLRYRDFLTVALVLDGEDLFPDNWIYIHEEHVEVGRIQNFRSWSPWMVPDPDTACVGMEYFCFKGDELWNSDDDDLIAMASRELEALGLAKASQVRRGYVVRVPKAYPVYDAEYAERVATIREWLDPLEGFVQVGRNGLHRYNNSDHSMLSAMRAVDNMLHGARHDIWAVNVESAYHEEQTDADSENPYKNVPVTAAMKEEERAMAEAA
jgi:protoporphyrinogen oxidase